MPGTSATALGVDLVAAGAQCTIQGSDDGVWHLFKLMIEAS